MGVVGGRVFAFRHTTSTLKLAVILFPLRELCLMRVLVGVATFGCFSGCQGTRTRCHPISPSPSMCSISIIKSVLEQSVLIDLSVVRSVRDSVRPQSKSLMQRYRCREDRSG